MELNPKLQLIFDKAEVMKMMLNGELDWNKGCIIRQAMDIQFEEGGDLLDIIKTRFVGEGDGKP